MNKIKKTRKVINSKHFPQRFSWVQFSVLALVIEKAGGIPMWAWGSFFTIATIVLLVQMWTSLEEKSVDLWDDDEAPPEVEPPPRKP